MIAGEDLPVWFAKNKKNLQKVMFLCLVARPRFSDGICTFNRKIGLWAFVEEMPAIWSSKNRPKGTMELKNISVSKDVFWRCVWDFVIPSIIQRWP